MGALGGQASVTPSHLAGLPSLTLAEAEPNRTAAHPAKEPTSSSSRQTRLRCASTFCLSSCRRPSRSCSSGGWGGEGGSSSGG